MSHKFKIYLTDYVLYPYDPISLKYRVFKKRKNYNLSVKNENLLLNYFN